MYLERFLDIGNLLRKNSVFLFGPRATGKSTLVTKQLSAVAEVIDLLDPQTSLKMRSNPAQLEEIVTHTDKKIVVIDEIQKLPLLLDSVHRLIERQKVCFLLMGSSARQLRRGGVNLLGGRAWPRNLFPLTSREIPALDLDRYLHCGGLPRIYLSKYPEQDLHAYVATYMQEEIQAEGLTRNLPAFSRFLHSMALCNGEILNFEKLANDCQVATSTVKGYVQVAQDTLLGSLLEPWRKSQKRKAVARPKFYFFDTGVTRVLSEVDSIPRNSALYGKSFEHFIWMELRAWLSYSGKNLRLTFWRASGGSHEVDFLVGEKLAIEVKATQNVSKRDLKGLRALAEEGVCQKLYLVSHDPLNRKSDTFVLQHWQTFLANLWDGKII